MSNSTKFLLSVGLNFVALAIVSILFEYFDLGDDSIYDMKTAAKNLIMALVISGTIVLMNRKAGDKDRV